MATAASNGPMVATFRDNSKAESCMVLEAISGKMVGGMRVLIDSIRNMEKARIHTQMGVDIEANGKMACSMGSAA